MPWQDTIDDDSVDADFGMLAAVSEYSASGGGLQPSRASAMPTEPGLEHALSHIDGPDPAPDELYWYALEQATQDPHPPVSDRPPAELAAMHLVSEAEERGDAWHDGMEETARSDVSEIMNRDVLSVSPSASLKEVHDLLAHSGLAHVPVVEGQRVIGMLSASALLRVSPATERAAPTADGRLHRGLRARHLMRSPVSTVRENASLCTAAQALCNGPVDALPVVDESRGLVGMLTSRDLVRALCNLRG
jgi:CBS domain-containing protein